MIISGYITCCEKCGQEFLSLDDYLVHSSRCNAFKRRKPLNPSLFAECPDCSRRYFGEHCRRNMRRHRKDECGKEPKYICQVCNYRFTQKGNLKAHLRSEDKERKARKSQSSSCTSEESSSPILVLNAAGESSNDRGALKDKGRVVEVKSSGESPTSPLSSLDSWEEGHEIEGQSSSTDSSSSSPTMRIEDDCAKNVSEVVRIEDDCAKNVSEPKQSENLSSSSGVHSTIHDDHDDVEEISVISSKEPTAPRRRTLLSPPYSKLNPFPHEMNRALRHSIRNSSAADNCTPSPSSSSPSSRLLPTAEDMSPHPNQRFCTRCQLTFPSPSLLTNHIIRGMYSAIVATTDELENTEEDAVDNIDLPLMASPISDVGKSEELFTSNQSLGSPISDSGGPYSPTMPPFSPSPEPYSPKSPTPVDEDEETPVDDEESSCPSQTDSPPRLPLSFSPSTSPSKRSGIRRNLICRSCGKRFVTNARLSVHFSTCRQKPV
ncbi:unnamed protein product [Cyprideis torosa]|uniref:Uncharacterized protein n=1 Tax=Cyprideis torosa TaxID=163714 RepID=A0A7R8ZK99_9CRUS|nr:unnamed protein product [Cyprideis torosa]CAG0881305.1 unnamed protein product [Cyprideis torosa]